MFHTECILCAGCADTCPRNAIELAFCLPPKREKAPAASPLSNAE
jgi:ferredoxin